MKRKEKISKLSLKILLKINQIFNSMYSHKIDK